MRSVLSNLLQIRVVSGCADFLFQLFRHGSVRTSETLIGGGISKMKKAKAQALAKALAKPLARALGQGPGQDPDD